MPILGNMAAGAANLFNTVSSAFTNTTSAANDLAGAAGDAASNASAATRLANLTGLNNQPGGTATKNSLYDAFNASQQMTNIAMAQQNIGAQNSIKASTAAMQNTSAMAAASAGGDAAKEAATAVAKGFEKQDAGNF